MRFIAIALIVLKVLAFQDVTIEQGDKSYWLNLRDSFPFKNLTHFVVDKKLEAAYKSYPLTNSSILPVAAGWNMYLYSWQVRDSAHYEFTTILDHGEVGLKIFYFIFDKNDKLLSSKLIAGLGGEGGYRFEGTSTFVTKNKLLHTSAVSTHFDHFTGQEYGKYKGDSTFSYLIINNKGQFFEKQFKQKREIKYD